ncbi:MAG: efflux RND transporter permease subunit [Pirellulaceae bacterium]
MLTRLFCTNSRLLILTIGMIVVAGLASLAALPRMEDPVLTPRFASITTVYPGASAERVESLVTKKIESTLDEVTEIKEIHSVNRTNVSFLVIELNDEIQKSDVQTAWSKIRDKVDDSFREMPGDVQKPEFKQLDVKAHAQLLGIVWNQESPASYSILRRLAKRFQDRIDAIPGTEKTTIFGDSKEEIVVEIPPEAANSIGLTPGQIAHQIFAGDAKVPAGQLRGGSLDLLLEVSGELDTLTRISQIPIKSENGGRIVELGDMAMIRKTIPDPPPAKAIVNGKPAVVLGVLVKDSQRLDHWSIEANQTIDAFINELPNGTQLVRVFEQSPYVEQRFSELWNNFLLGGACVLVTVLLVMGWRAAIVIGTTLPLACLMVLAVLLLMGIPLHQMSITGLVIAMGLLIDNAIVVVDEISRRTKQGHSRMDAIVKSVRFLIAPLIGSTVTTVVSFAPIALMPGPSGEFVGSIAISTIVAVVSSFVLALTIVPGMSRLMLAERNEGFMFLFNPLQIPERILRWTLATLYRAPFFGVLVCVTPAIVGFAIFPQLREQFFPPAERDQFQIELELSSSASMRETESMALLIREEALQHPEIEEVTWFIGESAPAFYYNIVPEKQNVPNYAQALVKCTDQRVARRIMLELQDELLTRHPQVHCVVRQLEQGPPFSAPIEVRIFGSNSDTLRQLGEQVRLILTQTPRVTHTRSELAETTPKVVLSIDGDEAQMAGYDETEIAAVLSHSLDGVTGGSVLEGTEELPVRVRINSQKRRDLNEVASLLLPTRQTMIIGSHSNSPNLGTPIGSLAELKLSGETSGTVGLNGMQMNEIQAFLSAGVLPADALLDFQSRLDASGFELPKGYTMSFGGAAGERNEAVGNLMVYVAILIAILIATLVLALRSFRLAALVGVVAGLSVGVSIAVLWLLAFPFGFMAIVGLMGMIGVVINDSIVVLASIQDDELARQGDLHRLVDVVVENIRHVALTTITTLVGFTPLIVGGGEFWPPVAICVASGVAAATFFAIVLVPCGYRMLYRLPAVSSNQS